MSPTEVLSPPVASVSDARRAISDVFDKQLFFIGGSPKSGTTWLQLLLNAHSEVMCHGETHFFDMLAPTLVATIQEHNDYIRRASTRIFDKLGHCPSYSDGDIHVLLQVALALLMGHNLGDENIKALGEKTPSNIRRLSTFSRILPGAKFIHIVRDGRDCAISGWFHNLRLSEEWVGANFPTIKEYVINFAKEWAVDQEQGDSFRKEAPERYHRVRYEDLLARPLPTLAALARFIGVSEDEQILSDCIAAASFGTLSGGRQPGNEDRSSFFRFGTAGNWRTHFDSEMEIAFTNYAGHWMTMLGYR